MASLFHKSSIKGHPHLMLGHLHSLQNHRLKVLLFVLWKERGELSDCISYIKTTLCREGCAVAWLGAVLQAEKSPAPKGPWPRNGRLGSQRGQDTTGQQQHRRFVLFIASSAEGGFEACFLQTTEPEPRHTT